MSQTVDIAFVQAFGATVFELAQQMNSRFRGRVTVETGVIGRSKDYDRIGSTEMSTRTTRHGDSPLMDTPHSRRRVTFVDKHWGDMIDDLDKVKTLINPENAYTKMARAAAGRQIDNVVIAALDGNATVVDNEGGGSSQSFAGGQIVAVGYVEGSGSDVNSNLTVPKLREAKRLFLTNEVPDDEPLTIAVRGSQIMSLLQDDEVTSSDYSSLQALMRGDITMSTFMGMTFIHSERLVVESTDHYHVPVFTRRGLQLSFNQDIKSRIGERPDKEFNMYVYFAMALGAVRMDELDVVRILCDETPA